MSPQMVVSLIFSIINVVVNLPILLNLIVDVVLTPFIIQRVVRLIEGFTTPVWCQNDPRPWYPPPIPNCDHWKFVVTVLMWIIAGFGGIIAYVLAFEN